MVKNLTRFIITLYLISKNLTTWVNLNLIKVGVYSLSPLYHKLNLIILFSLCNTKLFNDLYFSC